MLSGSHQHFQNLIKEKHISFEKHLLNTLNLKWSLGNCRKRNVELSAICIISPDATFYFIGDHHGIWMLLSSIEKPKGKSEWTNGWRTYHKLPFYKFSKSTIDSSL